MAELIHVLNPIDKKINQHVIFIHGLGGNPYTTWSTLENQLIFWPQWLASDIPSIALWTVGYAASISKWRGKAMHITDRATNVLESLLAEPDLRDGEIILIGHSMGGLIIKQMLRTADSISYDRTDALNFIQRVRRVAFLATPHSGSGHATFLDRGRIFFLPSQATASLVRNDPNLKDLNNWYREWSNRTDVKHLILAENESLSILGKIVPSQSADPGLKERSVLTDADHLSICKPSNKSADIYQFIKSFIERELNNLHPDALVNAKLDQLLSLSPSPSISIVDDKIFEQLDRIKKARFFAEFLLEEHLLGFVEQLLNGDYQYGSKHVKSVTMAWCARLLSTGQYKERSNELLKIAREYDFVEEIAIAEAFLIAASGDYPESLRKLMILESPEANSASLRIVNNQADIDTLEWYEKSALTFKDLDPEGQMLLLQQLIENGQWTKALEYSNTLDDNSYNSTPALLQIVAMINLAQAVPDEFKTFIVSQIPFEVRDFPLASIESALYCRRQAQTLFQQFSSVAQEFQLKDTANIAADYALWLELRDPQEHTNAINVLKISMQHASPSLRKLNFALQFDLELDYEMVEKEIERQTARSGGKSIDAAFARFALIFKQKSSQDILNYIERHRIQLESNLNKKGLWLIEVEILAKTGIVKGAEERLALLISNGLSETEENRLRNIINEQAGENLVEAYKMQYEASNSLNNLNNLISQLENQSEWGQLCKYLPICFEHTKSLVDAERLARAFQENNQFTELEKFLSKYQEFLEQSDQLRMLWGWILYRKGLLVEAENELVKLKAKHDHQTYRDLEINLIITSGKWEAFFPFIENEWGNRDQRTSQELMRSANIALSIGSPRSKDLLITAVEKANNDPIILAGAYFFASRAGWENDTLAGIWLHIAMQHSNNTGPLQQISLEELAEHIPVWNDLESDMWRQVYEGNTPLYVAAHLMNKTLLDLYMLPALHNPSEEDVRRRLLIPAYSGNRETLLCTSSTIGMDVTSLLTLTQLDLLAVINKFFEVIYIPHSTLSWFFEEKQKITFHQPSRIKAANTLRDFLSRRKLHTFQSLSMYDSDLAIDVGEDLASFIAEAQITGDRQKLVITTYPVHRLNSFMREETDLSPYYPYLCSSLSLIEFLQNKGLLTIPEVERAISYLSLHDKKWPEEPIISSNSILYLDNVCVTYFQHLGILEKLAQAGFEVYISNHAIEESNGLLGYDKLTSMLNKHIDSLRIFLSKGLQTGKIKLGRMPDIDDKDFGTLKYHPTSELIEFSKESNLQTIIIDDRAINKHLRLTSEGKEVTLLTTFDLINTLSTYGIISLQQTFEYHTKLRQYGYMFVPISKEELSSHLNATTVFESEVNETAELKAIRENLLRIRMSSFLQLPQEAYWLSNLMQTLRIVLQEQWGHGIDVQVSIAKSNWIIDQLDLRGWAHCQTSDGGIWMATFSPGVQLLALVIAPTHCTPKEQEHYWEWLDTKILNELKQKEPTIYKFLLNQAEELIERQLDNGVINA